MTRRRLPLALLGAVFGLVVAVVPAAAHPSSAAGSAHAALSVGHPTEALLVVEHPRALSQLPPAVGAHSSTPPLGPARASVARAVYTPGPSAVVPPAAIRGPPA